MKANDTGPKTPGMPPITTLVTAPPAASKRERGVLTVLIGSEPGRLYSIPTGPVVTIGRAADCVFRLEGDASISTAHAYLVHAGGEFTLRDAGSTNGTYVNDLRLSPEISVALREGDRVR